jgi:hypothetical protein
MSDAAFRYIESKRRRELVRAWLTIVAALLTLGIVFAQLAQLRDLRSHRSTDLEGRLEDAQLVRLAREVSALRRDADKTQALLADLPAREGASVEISQLASQLKLVDERLMRLEEALSATPEKALAVPLLRKELDAAVARLAEQGANTAKEMDRLYSVLLWVLGVLATAALGAGGAAFALLKEWRPKRQESASPPTAM